MYSEILFNAGMQKWPILETFLTQEDFDRLKKKNSCI